MSQISPGEALRTLQRAQAGMKKTRQAMRALRGGDVSDDRKKAVFRAGWASLQEAHQIMAAVAPESTDEAVLTRQLAVQRYATSLLVRLRRLARNEVATDDSDDADDDDSE